MDENILIQLGKGDKTKIVSTHFPCSCVEDGESLMVIFKPKKVEDVKVQHCNTVFPRDRYSVFCIDTEGGFKSKTKPIFRNNAVKGFKYLCVYGVKGITVKEALQRDGRFIDDLGDFTLTDNQNPNVCTHCTQRVDNLDQKEFKICLNKTGTGEKRQESPSSSNRPQSKLDNKVISKAAQQRGVSVKTVIEQRGSDNTDEIYEQLQQQFTALKRWMESRFPGQSYQEEVKLKQENFGKIQQAFSEVHRVSKLLQLGESVCKVIVQNVCEGTGFVLFDNFILTNAHLFNGYVKGKQLQDGINVFALFNYDEPQPKNNYTTFSASQTFIDFDVELDYAVLELHPQKSNNETNTLTVPPGLLKEFGPMPKNSEACTIGHPRGGVKKMDPTCIIGKEMREQAVNDHLDQYKDTLVIVHSISQVIRDRGIKDIMVEGRKADDVGTYNTFMYHGSCGSPVFDAHCRVCGLHTAGYTHGFQGHEESVIEFAHSLISIFAKFVSKLKDGGNKELMEKVKREAQGNPHLKKVLGPDEPMAVNGE